MTVIFEVVVASGLVVLIVKVKNVFPSRTVTEGLTVANVEVLAIVTTIPPGGTGALKVKVPWVDVPPRTEVGLIVRPVR